MDNNVELYERYGHVEGYTPAFKVEFFYEEYDHESYLVLFIVSNGEQLFRLEDRYDPAACVAWTDEVMWNLEPISLEEAVQLITELEEEYETHLAPDCERAVNINLE